MSARRSFNQEAVARRLAGGDIAAFNEIYAAYSSIVYKEAYRLLRSSELAKDLVQEVFTLLWDKRASFTKVEHLRAYLITISKNLAYQYLLRLSKEVVAKDDLSFSLNPATNSTEQAVNFNELERLLEQAVDALPDRQRDVYTLASNKGLDNGAIAEHLNISPNTVKNHLMAAKKFIRKILQHAALFIFWMLIMA